MGKPVPSGEYQVVYRENGNVVLLRGAQGILEVSEEQIVWLRKLADLLNRLTRERDELESQLAALNSVHADLIDTGQPFMQFVAKLIDQLTEAGLDMDSTDIVDDLERHGLMKWYEATEENRSEWEGFDGMDIGDSYWTTTPLFTRALSPTPEKGAIDGSN